MRHPVAPVALPQPCMQLSTVGHAAPLFAQLPVASQIWGWVPTHCRAPGRHAVHAPFRQVVAVHAAPLIAQLPVRSHICGWLPLHSNVPGGHTPEQAPPVHTLAQVVPLTQAPEELHV